MTIKSSVKEVILSDPIKRYFDTSFRPLESIKLQYLVLSKTYSEQPILYLIEYDDSFYHQPLELLKYMEKERIELIYVHASGEIKFDIVRNNCSLRGTPHIYNFRWSKVNLTSEIVNKLWIYMSHNQCNGTSGDFGTGEYGIRYSLSLVKELLG